LYQELFEELAGIAEGHEASLSEPITLWAPRVSVGGGEMGFLAKAEEMVPCLLQQSFPMFSEVAGLCVRNYVIGVHHSDAQFRHFVTVECVMLSVHADQNNVLGELVRDGTSLGDTVVVAVLHANPTKSNAVAEDVGIFELLVGEAALQLIEWSGGDCCRHLGGGYASQSC
jgi:hypothetical protein